MAWCIFSEFFRKLVFSSSRIGSSFRCLVEPCHLVSSQAAHRLNWFPCVTRCSVQWAPSGLLTRSCPWYHRFIFMVLGSIPAFLSVVDGVSREREKNHNSSLHGDGLRPVTICPTSRPNVVLVPPWSRT